MSTAPTIFYDFPVIFVPVHHHELFTAAKVQLLARSATSRFVLLFGVVPLFVIENGY